jgi:molecular chaperone GrpE (heat shock protein)
MGVLVNLNEWKRKKEEEAHKKELEEIVKLREELLAMMDDLGEVETGPYHDWEESDESFAKRLTEIMLSTLDRFETWPIDSSDL